MAAVSAAALWQGDPLGVGIEPSCGGAGVKYRVEHVIAVSASMVEHEGRPTEAVLQANDDGPFEKAAGAAIDLDGEALAEEGFEGGLYCSKTIDG